MLTAITVHVFYNCADVHDSSTWSQIDHLLIYYIKLEAESPQSLEVVCVYNPHHNDGKLDPFRCIQTAFRHVFSEATVISSKQLVH